MKKLTVQRRIFISLLCLGIIPALLMSVYYYTKASSSLKKAEFNKLTAVRDIKANSISQYFNTISSQVVTMAENKEIVDAMGAFSKAFYNFRNELSVTDTKLGEYKSALKSYYENDFSNEYKNQNNSKLIDVDEIFNKLDADSIALQYHFIANNPNPLGQKDTLVKVDSSSDYFTLHEYHHPVIRSYLKNFAYYDVFLVEPNTGDIVYTVFKELDFSTSLKDGPYSNTNIAEVYNKALTLNKGEYAFTDYKMYAPSYDAPASFIGSPIYKNDKIIGVIIFQMPLDQINKVMGERSGMGESGETYLLGQDLLMRSDSFLDPENHSVIASFRHPEKGKVETEASLNAFKGMDESKIIKDYNGNKVLSSYKPIELLGEKWAIIAEIDAEEAFITIFYFRIISLILLVIIIASVIILAFWQVNGISKIVSSLVGSISDVTKGSSDINDNNRDLSVRTQEQASVVEELSATIQELNNSISNILEQTHKAALDSGKAVETSNLGKQESKNIQEAIYAVNTSSKQILDIVTIIDEIAFQTNILAINAAIESAKAGEAGRSFAVVALEVRKLAQRVKDSNFNIKNIVSSSYEQVKKTTGIVEKNVAMLEDISNLISSVENQTKDIDSYILDQKKSIEQINIAVTEVDKVTQQNAAFGEELASVATNLYGLADNMTKIVNKNFVD